MAIYSDVLLREIDGVEYNRIGTGIATVGYGDLVVDSSYIETSAEVQDYPLFEAWSADVVFEDTVFQGTDGTPPVLLEGWGIFATLRDVTVQNGGTNTTNFQPSRPTMLLNSSYTYVYTSTFRSANCPPFQSCTASDYGNVLMELYDTGLSLQQSTMESSGVGIDAAFNSYIYHSGSQPLAGQGCADGRESLNYDGAVAARLGATSSLDLFVCNVGAVSTNVGGCIMAPADPMLDADCEIGGACTCDPW